VGERENGVEFKGVGGEWSCRPANSTH